MKREFDLRKLDPLIEQGMEEALKEFTKQFPKDKMASLGVHFDHQNGSFEIMVHADANDLPEDCLEFKPGYVGGAEIADIEGFDYDSFYFGEEDEDGEAIPEDTIFINAEGQQVRQADEDRSDDDFIAVILSHVKGLLVHYYAKRADETPRSVVIQAVASDPWFLGPLEGDGKSVPGFIKVPQPPALLALEGEPQPSSNSNGRTLYEVMLPSTTFKNLWFAGDEAVIAQELRERRETPCAEGWKPLKLGLEKGQARIGHVAQFVDRGWFGVSPVALKSKPFRELLEATGELLPVTVEGEDWKVYHCTSIVDEELIKTPKTMEEFFQRKPNQAWVVRLEHLPKTGTLFAFRGAHDPSPRMLTLSGSGFKATCEALGLQGIKFIPRWSEDPKVEVVPGH